jgi:hypothetical protein
MPENPTARPPSIGELMSAGGYDDGRPVVIVGPYGNFNLATRAPVIWNAQPCGPLTTVGVFMKALIDLENSDRGNQETIRHIEANHGSIAGARVRLQAAGFRAGASEEIKKAPGADIMQFLCELEGDGLSAKGMARQRAKLCRAKGLTTEQADAMQLEIAAKELQDITAIASPTAGIKGTPGRRGYPIAALEYAKGLRRKNPRLKAHSLRQECLKKFAEDDLPPDGESFRRWLNRRRANRAN